MSKAINSVLFVGLMLLVVLSPLPIGSNRPWSWSLCAVVISLLTAAWAIVNLGKKGQVSRMPPMILPGLFALALYLGTDPDGSLGFRKPGNTPCGPWRVKHWV